MTDKMPKDAGFCTIHQRMSGWDQYPLYKGSEIRVPGGHLIPRAELVSIGPSQGNHHWEAVIRMPIHFGEPIANPPAVGVSAATGKTYRSRT